MDKHPVDLRIVHYLDARVTDPLRTDGLSWQKYQGARNLLLRTCRQHGSVGSMGECPIRDDVSDPWEIEEWNVETKDPEFYVLDDQLNKERYLYVCILHAGAITSQWFADVTAALMTLPGWGVCVTNITNGYLIVMPPTLLVSGTVFSDCRDLEQIIDRTKRFLKV